MKHFFSFCLLFGLLSGLFAQNAPTKASNTEFFLGAGITSFPFTYKRPLLKANWHLQKGRFWGISAGLGLNAGTNYNDRRWVSSLLQVGPTFGFSLHRRLQVRAGVGLSALHIENGRTEYDYIADCFTGLCFDRPYYFTPPLPLYTPFHWGWNGQTSLVFQVWRDLRLLGQWEEHRFRPKSEEVYYAGDSVWIRSFSVGIGVGLR